MRKFTSVSACIRHPLFAILILVAAGAAHETCWADDAIYDCLKDPATKNDGAARLLCYDKLAREHLESQRLPECGDKWQTPENSCRVPPPSPNEHSLIAEWYLGDDNRNQSWRLTDIVPFRPAYVIARNTTSTNNQPNSPAPGHLLYPAANYQSDELKFQLSFKTEFISPDTLNSVFKTDNFRVWGAFTQQSNWQIFDGANSRPFRESNYQPEIIVTQDLTNGGDSASVLKMINYGAVHQSNGQSDPLSRSWNRLYVQGGWQITDNISLLGRAWYVIPEHDSDNPDILSYLGHGDVEAHWANGNDAVEVVGRNNMHFDTNRGFLQVDWSHRFDFIGPKVHFQYTSGFGESLIDYNHRQRTIGIGISAEIW
jgi:phospholipase A1